jgi:hypothetical protein
MWGGCRLEEASSIYKWEDRCSNIFYGLSLAGTQFPHSLGDLWCPKTVGRSRWPVG